MTSRPTPRGRLSRGARGLVLAAAVLLAGMYVTPLWQVRLAAPQYPEGIGMIIRLNTIEGMKEHDLRNINALNHYIGMKEIVPDAIPELKLMPWILAGLIVTGVVVALLGRRRLLVGWTALLVLLGMAGLADFYRWGYDYGHNLDPKAIIVVPGMSYQPPVIGTKQLLNFRATSLPHVGGGLAGLAFLAACGAILLSYRGRRSPLTLAGAALLTGCAAGAPQIALGQHSCEQCHMLLTDGRFGAAIVTSTGKTLTFDGVDCLLEYLEGNRELRRRSLWVADAATPGTLVPAEQATYVLDGTLRAPMGTLVSFATARDAGARTGATGRVLSWSQLRELEPAEATRAP